MRQKVLAVAAATLLALGGAVMAAGPANAASPGTCVQTGTWNDGVWKRASSTNRCTSTQRFYFRWDRAIDGGCSSLKVNYSRSEGRLYQARFAGLTNC